MAWTVALRPRARADVEYAAEWFGRKGRTAESRWRVRFLYAVAKLEADPYRYPQADDYVADGLDLRELLVGRRRGIVHRVLFSVAGDTVTIHRVRHAAQDALTDDDI